MWNCTFKQFTSHRLARRGITALEVTLALSLLIAAAVLLAQFVSAGAAQRRTNKQRRIAMSEVANRMETALAAKWDDVSAQKIQEDPLSEQAKESLPQAQLNVKVMDEAEPVARKIRIELSWTNSVGERVDPIGVTAWRYRREEDVP